MEDKSKILSTIEEQINSVVTDHFPTGFKFRPYQKESIIDTIYNWLYAEKTEIISAPTGSGKSVTAMIIAGVLSKYYGKTGYILVSDLNLIDQYDKDVNKFFPEWAVIKGQQVYRCELNKLNFKSGVCKLKGAKTYDEIYSKYPECAAHCEYLIDRAKAIKSKVLVCSYSFWLIQQNVVKKKLQEKAPFNKRDFTICDEAHKIVSIVQNHFSPKFGHDDMEKFQVIADNVETYDTDSSATEPIKDLRDIIWNTDDNAKLHLLLKEYAKSFDVISDYINTISRDLTNKTDEGLDLTPEDRKLAYLCDWANDHIASFNDYVDIIDKIGPDNIVKNETDNQKTLMFNCIDESYLMGKCFHDHCEKQMFMSATIGEPNAFAKDSAIGSFAYMSIPSTFDFTNSPIFYVNNYKLSFKEKEFTLPKIIELIEYTIRMYAGYRGIIQTGSYQFAKALYEGVSQPVRNRLIIYDDSDQKKESLDRFKKCTDKILVGPSLIEGLSFDDDLCRFQIIMKVPYPSLKDKFVSAKQKMNPEWYSNTTAISILQGVGRGVRNEKDWCVTFIFDGCFTYLYNVSRTMFPEEFNKRLQYIQPEAIINHVRNQAQ